MLLSSDKFPEGWPRDSDFFYMEHTSSVDVALEITRELYNAIDNGIISTSIYIKKSKHSIRLGCVLGTEEEGKEADRNRNLLIKRLGEIESKLE
ncbi:MAG: hypothetical protein WBQ25_20960 [Nitrososphaeraceae archaeon]